MAPVTEATSHVRYRVLFFAIMLGAITYLDRVCIAITAKPMSAELGLSDTQMGIVFSAFTLAYGLFEIPTGHWGDIIGTRKVLTRIVAWWSTFTILTSTAFNYPSLLVLRFLFGAGEAGAWPNVAKTFSTWFPKEERGRAQGIFFIGAHLAGGLTPLLVQFLLTMYTWRMVFVIFGCVGFVWAASWWWWYRDDPAMHPSVSPRELREIQQGRVLAAPHALDAKTFWRLLGNRNVLALCGMYFTQTYGFYFFITWLPKYLEKERGFSSTQLSIAAGLPMLLSVAADVGGGFLTDFGVKRFGHRWGRAAVGVMSFVTASAAMFAGTAATDALWAALFLAIAAAAGNFTLGAAWGACIDIGGNRAGLIGAMMNTSGQVGGFLSPMILGFVIDTFHHWEAPLYATAVLYAFGGICWLFVDASKPLEAER